LVCSWPTSLPPEVRADLHDIQHDLFDVGGELSIPGYTSVGPQHVTRLENELDRYNADLTAAQGIHPARRIAQCGVVPYRAHRMSKS
jgi:cob(I)alamin adenosyltransferase